MTSVLVIGLLVGLAIGLPISIVMGVVSLASFLVEGTLPLAVLPQRLFAGVNSFPIMAIPFFILAADLMSGGFLTDSLIRLSNDRPRWPYYGRAGPRQRVGQHVLCRNKRVGSGRRGRAGRSRNDHDAQCRL